MWWVATYGGGCGQLDRATGHFGWERPPQATPKPDHHAAGADAAGADAAGADAAETMPPETMPPETTRRQRRHAARDEAAGDEAAGDEPRRQQKQPCCAPDRRPSERPPEASAKGGGVWQPGPGQLGILRAPEEQVEKQGLNSPLLHSFGALPALELLQGETGPRG